MEHNSQDQIELLKHITNIEEFTFGKSYSLGITVGSHKSLETADDGRNGFPKRLLGKLIILWR